MLLNRLILFFIMALKVAVNRKTEFISFNIRVTGKHKRGPAAILQLTGHQHPTTVAVSISLTDKICLLPHILSSIKSKLLSKTLLDAANESARIKHHLLRNLH
jgi:hypothetical protein